MSEPLRILMITHHRKFKTFGRPLVMARYLAMRGHTITLISTADHNRAGTTITQEGNVRIVEAPDLLWGRLRSGWDLWGMANRFVFLAKDRQAYDLVHCFETRPATIYPAMAYARRHHLPLLTDWNDWFGRGGLVNVLRPRWYQNTLAWIETYYEEAFRERAAGTTVISSALGLRAQKLGIPPDRICLITGGTNPTLFPTRPMDDCRTHMGYPLDCPILGFASADSHLDLDIVLAALAIVAGRYPNVKLIITGKISQTTLEAAQRSGVMEHLIFPGFIPAEELSWCLGSANILLLPYPETIYNLGRWPNKLGLYFSLGRPVVTNPVGDVKRLFDDQPVGLTTDATPQAFAEGIINLIEQPDLARQMGQAAEQVALNQLNWKNLIGELESFYYKILEGKDKHS